MCMEPADMKRRYQLTKFLLSVTLIHLYLSTPSVFASLAANLTIGSYTQTSATRVSGYQYDYTYTAVITNTGPTITAVIATLTSSDANIQIIDGTLTLATRRPTAPKVGGEPLTFRRASRSR